MITNIAQLNLLIMTELLKDLIASIKKYNISTVEINE